MQDLMAFGLLVGLTEFAVWSVSWLSHGGELVALFILLG